MKKTSPRRSSLRIAFVFFISPIFDNKQLFPRIVVPVHWTFNLKIMLRNGLSVASLANSGDNKSTSGNFIILISPRNSPLASFAPLFLPSSSANKVAGLVQSPYEQNLQHRGLVHKENFLLHLSYLVASYSIFPNIFTLDNQ